jgi:hypothetical protein
VTLRSDRQGYALLLLFLLVIVVVVVAIYAIKGGR